jgi:hypothetical protein
VIAGRRRGRAGSLVAAVVLALLAGAALFGLWHVVVGGLVNGNPRAAAFGVGLAGVAASSLIGSVLVIGRRRG